MVLGWCISFADAMLLIFLSKLVVKAEEKEKARKKSSCNIDYMTGQKLPYIKEGDGYYVDTESGVKIDDVYEDYDVD